MVVAMPDLWLVMSLIALRRVAVPTSSYVEHTKFSARFCESPPLHTEALTSETASEISVSFATTTLLNGWTLMHGLP